MIGLFQPEGGRRLATHPITDKLVMAVNFANQDERTGIGNVQAIIPEDTGIAGPGRYLSLLVGYATGVNRYGKWVGFDVVGANTILDWARSDFVPTSGGCTILMLYEKGDTTNRGAFAFTLRVVDGLNTRCSAHVPFSDGTVYWDFGGATEDVTRESVAGLSFGADRWVFSTGARGMEIWQNGIKRSSNSANPSRTASVTSPFALGAKAAGTGVNNDIAHYNLFAMWARQLTTEEILMVSADPYMLWEDGSSRNLLYSASGAEIVAADTISPTGIATGEAFGTARIVEIGPDGIESAEFVGFPDLIGTPGAAGTLLPTAITSLEAFGTAVLTEVATIYPTGIASGFDMDLHAVGAPVGTFQPSGIASAEGFGTPTLFTLANPPRPAAGSVTAKKLCSPLGLIRAEVFADAPDPAFILPDVYGDFSTGGIRGPVPTVLVTNATPFVYIAAAHPVYEITHVYVDDVEQTSGFITSTAVDLGNGFQIATIAFSDQPTGPVSWRGKGRMDDTGVLIENAIDQLQTLLTHRAGYTTEDFDATTLAEAQALATTIGWTPAWVFQDDRQVQDWVTEIMFNVMGIWRVSGRAQLQLLLDDGSTPPATSIVASIIASRDCVDGDDGVEFVADRDHLVNKLTAYYLWSWSLNQASSRLIDYEDPVSVHAHQELRKSVTLRGLRDAAQVETWSEILFARQSFAHRVEGALLGFKVEGSLLAHVAIGDILAFSWTFGPTRELGNPYHNQLLRVLTVSHDFSQGGITTIVAADTGTFVHVNGVRVLEPLVL